MSTPWPMGTQALQVGDLLIDLRFRRIVSAEGSVELQHRIFDLLLLLISEPDRLFTRQELFDRLWAGLVVDDANLSQSIWLLRKALGESRREWIRTVAKRGYVFQPPGPVQWFDSMPPVSDPAQIEAASDPEAAVHAAEANSVTEAVPEADHDADAAPANADGDAGPVAAEAPSAPATPEEPGVAPLVPRRRRHLWVTAAAALLVVVAGLALWTFWPRTDSPVTVALMPLQSNAGADVPWASELLVQWSSWKLQQLPEVQLLNGEDLAQGKALPPPHVVLLSAVRSADGKHVVLRARVQRKGRDQMLEREVALAEAPAAIDALSRELVTLFVPGPADRWPALEVDSTSAQQYAVAAAAFDRGDWRGVQQAAKEVLAGAPRFGLMHLQLAIAQSNLGENLEAVRHMELARTLLAPLPGNAARSLEARQLEMDPRRARDAETALKDLLQSYPAHAPYQRRYVRLLIETGQFRKAISQLGAPTVVADTSVTARYQRAVAFADAYYGLGEFERSREAAASAQAIAEAAGEGMRAQAAEAALQGARAIATMEPAKGESAYQHAAQLLQQAGIPRYAEYAEVLAIVHAGQAAHDNTMVATALKRAMRSGDLGLAADIQVTLANLSTDAESRLRWLGEALQTAQSLGNLNLQGQLEIELALEDLHSLQLTQAETRARQMQALGLEGIAGIRGNILVSRVFEMQGRLRDAEQAGRLALQASPAVAEGGNPDRSNAACQLLRITPLLGSGGDPEARAGCGETDDPNSRFIATLAKAWVALLSNDSASARQHYEAARVMVFREPGPQTGWDPALPIRRMQVAALALRVGDLDTAARLMGEVQAADAQGDLTPLDQALLAVLGAEIEAVRGQWADSRRWADRARELLPGSERELRQRLDLLQIADDQHHGRRDQALALAKRLQTDGRREGDVHLQHLVASLVPSLGSGDMRDRVSLRGATMAWLSRAERKDDVRPTVQPVREAAAQ
ncbi:winged helix-turn-helix domain-containing protein [Stenotrophomonas maltophilia]|uniref:winged helix-turn-helix domain-containing protein n=1 Tax=Stenotrophomonas maltophilia TaxID=40324 RepID=UPI002ACD1B9E|nr:winged helix-turn-helix domain-containing protein [Stenotrophomonas maltophilia]MDZ5789331.1 winged helix-turn-helix domain-containing protein [Stenotrophomonas maltophilia]